MKSLQRLKIISLITGLFLVSGFSIFGQAAGKLEFIYMGNFARGYGQSPDGAKVTSSLGNPPYGTFPEESYISTEEVIPLILTCPPNVTVECDAAADTGIATVTDDSTPPATVTSTDIVTPGDCPQGSTITRTWTATDASGNSSSCVQVIEIEDNTPPVLNCPPDITLECSEDLSSSGAAGYATATDNCSTPENITITEIDIMATGTCPQGSVIIRTWTATDECLNSSMFVQVITILDTTAPVITCPSDIAIECTEDPNSAGPAGLATAIDNCSALEDIIIIEADTELVGACPQGKVVTRTWTAIDECDNTSSCVQTITIGPTNSCVELETWAYLEGTAIIPDGFSNYSLPMRTSLNDLKLLPGQLFQNSFLGDHYTPAGQPYSGPPWNYSGTEGAGYDSGGQPLTADAGYPATVADWVLVSLRAAVADDLSPGNVKPDDTPICTAAALLHEDGSIQFTDDFECCELDLNDNYYLIIEHRSHLIVASHEPQPIVNGKISYDFRAQQSYIQLIFGTPNGVGQKEILPGVFALIAGNGDQADSDQADTDITFNDEAHWETENGVGARYKNGDYNMNGDTNVNDQIQWNFNNTKFTSVPRN